ncbi:MAG: FecCD family ABC transporter permease [Luteibaculaceae bacterium]
MQRKSVFILLFFMLVALALVAGNAGGIKISVLEVFKGLVNADLQSAEWQRSLNIWLNLRLPRVLLAVLVGGALALSGAAMQGLFRNPLADPAILGTSSGAAMMAALCIYLASMLGAAVSADYEWLILPTGAFLGALVATYAAYKLGGSKSANIATLLLAGIAINAFAGAITGLFTFLATDNQLRNFTFWTLGSLGGASWRQVSFLAVILALAAYPLIKTGKTLNMLALGKIHAQAAGISIEKTNRKLIFLVALLVGVSVSFCGIIGFVGLVVPHILRLVIGPDNRFLIPASALLGAILLLLADTLARTVVLPAELPIGIVTAFAGVPFFMLLLHRITKLQKL